MRAIPWTAGAARRAAVLDVPVNRRFAADSLISINELPNTCGRGPKVLLISFIRKCNDLEGPPQLG